MTTAIIGTNIRKRRIALGHNNYARFAKENGLNPSMFHRWECGQDILLSNLLKVSAALKINPIELFK